MAVYAAAHDAIQLLTPLPDDRRRPRGGHEAPRGIRTVDFDGPQIVAVLRRKLVEEARLVEPLDLVVDVPYLAFHPVLVPRAEIHRPEPPAEPLVGWSPPLERDRLSEILIPN